MDKIDKQSPPDSHSSLKEADSSVTLELLLDENLKLKLDESARQNGIPSDKFILRILTKRFKKH